MVSPITTIDDDRPAPLTKVGGYRNTWPDIYRGIAIIAVVVIHSSGHAMAQLSHLSWSWFVVASVNRALQFAVPAFLLVSAYLNTASLVRASDCGYIHLFTGGIPAPDRRAAMTLVMKRVRAIGLPYLLASIAGAIVDMHAGLSMSPRHFVKELVLFRASYHLYFIALILQMYVMLPFAARLFARRRSLTTVVLTAGSLQVLVFALNRWLITTPVLHNFRQACPTANLSSTVLWYLLPLAVGMWLFAEKDRAVVAQASTVALWTAVIALPVYVGLAVLALVQPVDTIAYQAANWVFTTAASMALAGWSVRLSTVRVAAWLTVIGRQSLTIYLAHPFVIDLVDVLLPGVKLFPLVSIVVYGVVAVTVCLALSIVNRRLAEVVRVRRNIWASIHRSGRQWTSKTT